VVEFRCVWSYFSAEFEPCVQACFQQVS
jgi:hypothetical protein